MLPNLLLLCSWNVYYNILYLFSATSALCTRISTLLSHINCNWELLRGTRAKKAIDYLSLRGNHMQSTKTRGWETTPKLGTCNRTRCAEDSHKEGVDFAGSPHQEVLEKTGWRKVCHEMKTNERPQNPKQSKWAKHLLPCSPQDTLIMVTASPGINWLLHRCFQSLLRLLPDLPVCFPGVWEERKENALSGQENIM